MDRTTGKKARKWREEWKSTNFTRKFPMKQKSDYKLIHSPLLKVVIYLPYNWKTHHNFVDENSTLNDETDAEQKITDKQPGAHLSNSGRNVRQQWKWNRSNANFRITSIAILGKNLVVWLCTTGPRTEAAAATAATLKVLCHWFVYSVSSSPSSSFLLVWRAVQTSSLFASDTL